MKAMLLAGGMLALASVAPAQQAPRNSAPAASAPIVDTIPPPVDRAYPGTMLLEVDATDTAQGIVRVVQTVPVAGAGDLVLLYPKWLPGTHAPEGEATNLVGLTVSAGGKRLAWRRDPVDMYAFHVDVPAGTRAVRAEFQWLSSRDPANQERVTITPVLANLQWEKMSLYPAGYYTRRIPVTAKLTLPAGWTAYTALRGRKAGATTTYGTVPYETLVDSPVFAGRHARSVEIGRNVRLNIVGDSADAIAITPDQIEKHKALVTQADRLFGARHYDRYDFLYALSDTLSGIGLEHHRSSENAVGADVLTDWDNNAGSRDLLPHEYVHSWNGKFRRGADLWTPDYRTPMRDSLLWVYEGQTTFWGPVLAVRSGMWTKDEWLGAIAGDLAAYAYGQPGQTWRPLQDTTNDPIVTLNGGISEWPSWSRAYDYYPAAALMWLEADQLIRQRSAGRRSLEDFARAFFGINDGDWGEVTYTFDDVVAALNGVEPYDWARFLHSRLDATRMGALGGGVTLGGYRLVFKDEPNAFVKANGSPTGVGMTYSLGMATDDEGKITNVRWDGPAFRSGLRPGNEIVAIEDRAWSTEGMLARVRRTATDKAPVTLLVKAGDSVKRVAIVYTGGIRYPHLEPIGTGARGIDTLLTPR